MLVYRMPPLTQLAYIISHGIASRKLAARKAIARNCLNGRIGETLPTRRAFPSPAGCGAIANSLFEILQ
jgi:hypothetical protein